MLFHRKYAEYIPIYSQSTRSLDPCWLLAPPSRATKWKLECSPDPCHGGNIKTDLERVRQYNWRRFQTSGQDVSHAQNINQETQTDRRNSNANSPCLICVKKLSTPTTDLSYCNTRKRIFDSEIIKARHLTVSFYKPQGTQTSERKVSDRRLNK